MVVERMIEADVQDRLDALALHDIARLAARRAIDEISARAA